MNREDRIRAEAYRRWEKEGRPHGHDERHWREAMEAIGKSAEIDELETEGTTQALTSPIAGIEKPKRSRTKKPSGA